MNANGHPTTHLTPTPHLQPPPPGVRKQKGGRHGFMMIICCIPMLAIAIVLVATGVAGAGFMVAALACTAMMALMMRGMNHGGMNHGGMNHDRQNETGLLHDDVDQRVTNHSRNRPIVPSHTVRGRPSNR